MNDNYAYYMKSNLEQYLGQWVAVVDSKVVAHGENAKEVYDQARKLYPAEVPLLSCVPKSIAMIL